MRREGNIKWPLLLLPLLLTLAANAQRAKGGHGTIIGIGPVVGFYKLHTRHAVSPSAKTSFAAGIRREWRADRQFRTFVQLGAEYFVHGVNYGSYYFDQDTLQLYDKTFAYRYALYVHEINVPVQLKVLFNRGDNKIFSPYACVAYHLRYLVQGNLEIDEFGNRIKKDFPEMRFRNHLFSDRVNAFVSAGLGWQRNKISDKGAAFFAELTFRYGFSDYYFSKPYAASAVFVNSTHLVLALGLKL